MPTSARKSSIGTARRGPQKYIPYRADDLQHGKRTGYAVGYVERNSDEFEPFEQVIRQADLRTPPKPKNKKKRAPKTKTPIIELDDEDGEMSMELDDSAPNSPSAYLSHSRNGITSSIQRVGNSSRPVASRSDVDFNKVPSPRPASAFSKRQSKANGRSSGPSRLSLASARQDTDDEDEFGRGYDEGVYDNGFDPNAPPTDDESDRDVTPTPTPQRKQSLHRRPSFANMNLNLPAEDVDEDEEAQVEEEVAEEPTQIVETAYKDKGKRRASQIAEEEPDTDVDVEGGMEDDIAQGLAEVELQPEEPEEHEEQPEPEPPKRKKGKGRSREGNDSTEDQRPNKKVRIDDTSTEAKKKPRSQSRKENVLHEIVQDRNVDDDGVRRSQRMRYKPLEWWRLEKVVYGRRDSGQCLVPTIKEIRRLPKEEIEPLGAKHRRKRSARSKSVTVDPILDYNPEEGWDDKTESEGVVIDYETKEEITRRVAFTAKMVRTKQAANADFSFQKIFGDGDFMAAGQLLIPPNGQKPTKGTKDNTFIFYLIEGAVTFRVHRTSYILTSGSMFLVPRGNMYHIQNISDRDARLFFAQARKLPDDEGEMSEGSQSPNKSRSPRLRSMS